MSDLTKDGGKARELPDNPFGRICPTGLPREAYKGGGRRGSKRVEEEGDQQVHRNKRLTSEKEYSGGRKIEAAPNKVRPQTHRGGNV